MDNQSRVNSRNSSEFIYQSEVKTKQDYCDAKIDKVAFINIFHTIRISDALPKGRAIALLNTVNYV